MGVTGPPGFLLAPINFLDAKRFVKGVFNAVTALPFAAMNFISGENSHRSFSKDPAVRAEPTKELKGYATTAAVAVMTDGLLGRASSAFSPIASEAAGSWVSESTSGWSKSAISYQEQITGVQAGSAFEVNGVKFDGVSNGTLLEAKSSYDGFVNNKTGEFQTWFKGADALVDQANRQVGAADGAPIEWNFSSQKSLNATNHCLKIME
jgi:hypothetical protein